MVGSWFLVRSSWLTATATAANVAVDLACNQKL